MSTWYTKTCNCQQDPVDHMLMIRRDCPYHGIRQWQSNVKSGFYGCGFAILLFFGTILAIIILLFIQAVFNA